MRKMIIFTINDAASNMKTMAGGFKRRKED